MRWSRSASPPSPTSPRCTSPAPKPKPNPNPLTLTLTLTLTRTRTLTLTLTLTRYYLFGSLDKRTKSLADAYAGAGGVASEVLSGLRTVASLGLEHNALERYEAQLVSTQKTVTSSTQRIGVGVGVGVPRRR